MKKSSQPLTEVQAEWLKENYKKFRNPEIAAHFNIKEWRVSYWLKQLKLKRLKKGPYAIKKVKKKQEKFERPNVSRLPAEYSNITREQHIDRILSINTQNYSTYGQNI